MKKSIVAMCALAVLPVFGAFGASEPSSCFVRGAAGDITYDYIVYFKHDYPKKSREYCPNKKPVNQYGCCGNVDLRNVGGKDMCCWNANDDECYNAVFDDVAEDLTNGSEECARDLVSELNNVSVDGDTRILLLATTDKTGSHTYNDALSQRRLDLIKQLFGPNLQDRIITHLAGETNDNFTKTHGRNQAERTVRIFIARTPEQQAQAATLLSSAATHTSEVKVTIYKGDADMVAKRIKSIASSLDGMTNSLGSSVWKNKEGNFNSARLVSDSIAGVVLGTAGGLITSNVIKKNQIKGGFEDVKCTVGGQIVAEYGDEFTVGIR